MFGMGGGGAAPKCPGDTCPDCKKNEEWGGGRGKGKREASDKVRESVATDTQKMRGVQAFVGGYKDSSFDC